MAFTISHRLTRDTAASAAVTCPSSMRFLGRRAVNSGSRPSARRFQARDHSHRTAGATGPAARRVLARARSLEMARRRLHPLRRLVRDPGRHLANDRPTAVQPARVLRLATLVAVAPHVGLFRQCPRRPRLARKLAGALGSELPLAISKTASRSVNCQLRVEFAQPLFNTTPRRTRERRQVRVEKFTPFLNTPSHLGGTSQTGLDADHRPAVFRSKPDLITIISAI